MAAATGFIRVGGHVINADHVQRMERGSDGRLHVMLLNSGQVDIPAEHAQAVWDHFAADAKDITPADPKAKKPAK
jgi:hypothetical protein